MSGPQFFETRMGQTFYDGTMRRIATALEDIAKAMQPPIYGSPRWFAAATQEELATTARAEAWHALVGEMVELLHDACTNDLFITEGYRSDHPVLRQAWDGWQARANSVLDRMNPQMKGKQP